IELACLRGAKKLSHVVPRVFDATPKMLGFEEATSSSRAPNICAARVGEWSIAVDVLCRLSEKEKYLVEASGHGELYVVRVSTEPLELMYRAGKVAKLPKLKSTERDGELRAMAWLRERTGVDFAKDLWDAKFKL